MAWQALRGPAMISDCRQKNTLNDKKISASCVCISLCFETVVSNLLALISYPILEPLVVFPFPLSDGRRPVLRHFDDPNGPRLPARRAGGRGPFD